MTQQTKRERAIEKLLTRREILALPIKERQKILKEQANNPMVIDYYNKLDKQVLQDLTIMERMALFLISPIGDTVKTGFTCEDWNYVYETAKKLYAMLESLGYVRKAEDQSLPELRGFKETVYTCHNTKAEWFKDGQKIAQQDMLTPKDSAVWVKIKTEE